MKTYTDQVLEHLTFLKIQGIDVQSLELGRVVRCHELRATKGRGELAYSCHINELENGNIGLVTWCRGSSGEKLTFKTYGLRPAGEAAPRLVGSSTPITEDDEVQKHDRVARAAYGFWEHSSLSGLSDYLTHKGVSAYGLRFRSSEKYGNVAVVPMRDVNGKLWSYQLLNPDGSKRMPKDARTNGLFHILKTPVDGDRIGIAEGYATAATCFELSGVSTVCCFSSNNMPETTRLIRKMYPNSSLILFADNDHHLEKRGLPNQGLQMAQKTRDAVGGCIVIASPDLVPGNGCSDVSDWNDVVRVKGREFARGQILENIRSNH